LTIERRRLTLVRVKKASSPGQLVHELQVHLGLAGRQGPGAEASALAVMHEAGLTLPQVVVLSVLHHGDASQVSTLAELTGLSMSATSTLIQRLVEMDLVTREEDPDDRRQKRIELTRAGAALIERLGALRAAEIGRGFASLPPNLRNDLLDVLHRVVDHFRGNTSSSS
jgi:DNA-binding MarR family transcriptional regulator